MNKYKTCDTCRFFDICVDGSPNGAKCECYSKGEKISKVITPDEFGYSDAQIHGEAPYATIINNIREKLPETKYSLNIYTKDGIKHSFKGDAVEVKIYDIGKTTVLHVVTDADKHFDFNYSEIKWTEMWEE